MPIAEGKYTHYASGIANGITETWAQEPHKIVIQFETPAYQLQSDVIFDSSRRIESFSYHVGETLNGVYRVEGGKLIAKRSLPANTQIEDMLLWSDNAILDLPFLSTKGRTILHLDQHGTVPVFAPHLRSGDRAGDLAKKSVQQLGKATITIADVVYPATKYRYGHTYWLDEHGIVLRVETDDYEMELTEYTRFDSEF